MKNKGFTLIELMITVAIIGILAAIAYPSYRQYVLTNNRYEAKSSLMELSNLQENYYIENNKRYATSLGDGTGGLDAGRAGFQQDDGVFVSKNSKLDLLTGYYKLYFSSANATSYVLIAEAIGSQLEDTNCFKFTIDQASRKTATDNAGINNDKCW